MKKLIVGLGVVIMLTTLFIDFRSIAAQLDNNNLSIKDLATLAIASGESSSPTCITGGPGSTSCSFTAGPVSYGVTCSDGYYACCNYTGAACIYVYTR
ncbi:MAG: hypothetical protein JXB49_20245 [Bacteroidales bacterium]|nr:hypothetical protein [Bacteroidales bacterium]